MTGICRYHMASVSSRLLLLAFSSFLLGATSAQELYDDVPILQQYSPMLGENVIDYPMLEEYGVPSVEEFPDEGLEEDDQDEEDQESHFKGTENNEKKDVIKKADNEHAQKTPSALNSKNDAREKRQLPLQDDPVEMAREKLERAIKAAQALTSIEQELGLNPSTIENKTTNLESVLKSEEKTFKKMADESQDATKKTKFIKLEKDADDDMNKAENILKLIVNLEAAKFLAKQRAQDNLEEAEKRKLASSPPAILGQPVAYSVPQTVGYFGRVQQPVYQPMLQSYMAGYQPPTFQGMTSPSIASAPSTMLSPSDLASPTSTVPPYQPAYQDEREIQSINAIKATQASASLLPPQQTSQAARASPTLQQSAKVASSNTQKENYAIQKIPQPKQPPALQPPITALKAQPIAHEQSSNDHKVMQLHAKPQQTKEKAPGSVSTASESAHPVVPVKPVMPLQPITTPSQTIETAFAQSNGLLSQVAPWAASYNPGLLAPNLSPMSRYFDSSSDAANPFAPQSFNRPMSPHPQQTLATLAQQTKPNLKGPEPVKPVVTPVTAPFIEQPQTLSNPTPSMKLESPSPATSSYEQAPSATYPSNSFYPSNSQSFPSGIQEYSWNAPTFYPRPAASYEAPVNPLLEEAYRKLQNTRRAKLAMSKIEEAIGLSPSSVKHIIDDIETQAKEEEKLYEDDMGKERADINKEKALLQNDELQAGDNAAKEKIKEDEAKLRDDIRKENVAKSEVDKIKKIEKILTIIEAAKYSAMQRARKKMNTLQGADEGLDGEEIRKRDLEDLEKDMRRRRRNEINIWLKGSRNRIDTSHFLRNHLSRLAKHRQKSSRWGSYGNKLSLLNRFQVQNEERSEPSADEAPKQNPLHKLKFFKTLVSNRKLDSGKQFSITKRTEVQKKPKNTVDNFIMAKMLEKMDKLFKIQENILKYLKMEHDRHRQHDKKPTKRWRRSLHHSKHHKKLHSSVTKDKIKSH
ncbi:uncharacterized protein [Montipora capricornis]|uniref:uncharacterized protein isoform X1 n=1 Tax=Montipora capricornis TaxID=246305 RepID=UPI0035F16489